MQIKSVEQAKQAHAAMSNDRALPIAVRAKVPNAVELAPGRPSLEAAGPARVYPQAKGC